VLKQSLDGGYREEPQEMLGKISCGGQTGVAMRRHSGSRNLNERFFGGKKANEAKNAGIGMNLRTVYKRVNLRKNADKEKIKRPKWCLFDRVGIRKRDTSRDKQSKGKSSKGKKGKSPSPCKGVSPS